LILDGKMYALPKGRRTFILTLPNHIIKKEKQGSEKNHKNREAVEHPTCGAGRGTFRLRQGSFDDGLCVRHRHNGLIGRREVPRFPTDQAKVLSCL